MLQQLKQSLRLRTRWREARRWGVRYRWGWHIAKDWWIDQRFGGSCGGTVASPWEAQGATRTESATYSALDTLFREPRLQMTPSDVLVDIGCGKGRVINQWLRSGLRNTIIGIELTPAIGQWARTRLAPFSNVRIITGDAVALLPPEGTVFFLFNPFGRETMQAFAQQLLARTNTRSLRIVYLNARHLEVFDRETWKVQELESGSPDRAVLIRHAQAAVTESTPSARAPQPIQPSP